MATITFDTLKFVERLKAAGVPDAQAKAEAEALADALSESTSNTLATKQDIIDLRMELRELKVDLIKWMTGALIAQAAVIATLVKLL